MAYVGSLPLPQDRVVENAAYSSAGAMLQERMLESIQREGVMVSRCFVLRAIASFPKQKVLFSGFQSTTFAGVDTTMMPFVNLGALKALTVGLSTVVGLTLWGWRRSRTPERRIMCYNLSNPPGISVVIAGWLTRTPVYAIIADFEVPGSGNLPDTFLRRLQYWIQKKSICLFDGLIVLARRTAEEFAPDVPYLEMEGAVPDAYLPGAEAACGSNNGHGEFVIMYSGGLSKSKGTELLLESFQRLRAGHFRLWITGSGDMRSLVEKASTRDHRIHFFGFVPYSTVLELYSRASVLVNPHSCSEKSARYIFPSKLLEYMAAGRAVVSTVNGPEMMATYGPYLFHLKEETPAALAGLFEQVAAMTEEERRDAGERARGFVLKTRRWSDQGRRIAQFITNRPV